MSEENKDKNETVVKSETHYGLIIVVLFIVAVLLNFVMNSLLPEPNHSPTSVITESESIEGDL